MSSDANLYPSYIDDVSFEDEFTDFRWKKANTFVDGEEKLKEFQEFQSRFFILGFCCLMF